jgi:hypothetical protein
MLPAALNPVRSDAAVGVPPAPAPPDLITVCADLRAATRSEHDADEVRPERNPERDHLLLEYRRLLLEQVQDDAQVNRRELGALMREVASGGTLDPACTPRGADLQARIDRGVASLAALEPYRDSRTEERWWLALNQFYLDGLYFADRLLAAQAGRRLRRWRRPPRWHESMQITSPSRLQGLVTSLTMAVPELFNVNPFDTYVPGLLYMLSSRVFPSRRFRFREFFGSTLGWIHREGLARMRGLRGPVVQFEGLEHLHDGRLFDPATQRTRHNVIVASSHRLGYIDLPLFFEPLRKTPLAVWANNAFYGSGTDRKVADDRYTIAIRGSHAPPLDVAIARTAELLIEARAPVFIMVDGSQPPMFYGQQMRVKRGLRLAVNETVRQAEGTGRRTYVLPLSLNDPVGFLQRRQDVIRVKFHPPVWVESVREIRRPQPGDPAPTVEDADPLLNHLEALFLLETAHAQFGLPHPRVVAAARARAKNRHREPWLKRGFQTSLADLAIHAGQLR